VNEGLEISCGYGNIPDVFFMMYYCESKTFHPEYLALLVLLGQAGRFLTNRHEKIIKCVEILHSTELLHPIGPARTT
jgi:hypothetical protein